MFRLAGSTESVLPDTVLRRIAEEWLGFTFADSDYQDIPDMVDTPPSTDSDTDSNSNSDQGETAASVSDMDADQSEAAASGFDMDIYCPDWLDLDDHDILFTFLGQDLKPVEFRCTASRFLRSVWREPRLGCCRGLPPGVGWLTRSRTPIKPDPRTRGYWGVRVISAGYTGSRGPRPVDGYPRVFHSPQPTSTTTTLYTQCIGHKTHSI